MRISPLSVTFQPLTANNARRPYSRSAWLGLRQLVSTAAGAASRPGACGPGTSCPVPHGVAPLPVRPTPPPPGVSHSFHATCTGARATPRGTSPRGESRSQASPPGAPWRPGGRADASPGSPSGRRSRRASGPRRDRHPTMRSPPPRAPPPTAPAGAGQSPGAAPWKSPPGRSGCTEPPARVAGMLRTTRNPASCARPINRCRASVGTTLRDRLMWRNWWK